MPNDQTETKALIADMPNTGTRPLFDNMNAYAAAIEAAGLAFALEELARESEAFNRPDPACDALLAIMAVLHGFNSDTASSSSSLDGL